MEFNHPELKAKITTLEDPTIRQVLAYDSLRDVSQGEEFYTRLWLAAPKLIDKFECDKITLETSLDDVTSIDAVNIIKWTGLAVFSFRESLERVEKN